MKRFKFTLETLHGLRVREREKAERELAEITLELENAKKRVTEHQRACDLAIEIYSAKVRNGTVDTHESEMHCQYIATLERRIGSARIFQSELERKREEKMQEVIKAAAAAEATEKLRQQYYARYVTEMMREEQNTLDELATIASARRLRGTT